MAALIESETGVGVRLQGGSLGEFSVWLDGELVAKKGWIKLPPDEQVLAAVRRALRV